MIFHDISIIVFNSDNFHAARPTGTFIFFRVLVISCNIQKEIRSISVYSCFTVISRVSIPQAPVRPAAPAVAAAPRERPPPQLTPIPTQVSWMHP